MPSPLAVQYFWDNDSNDHIFLKKFFREKRGELPIQAYFAGVDSADTLLLSPNENRTYKYKFKLSGIDISEMSESQKSRVIDFLNGVIISAKVNNKYPLVKLRYLTGFFDNNGILNGFVYLKAENISSNNFLSIMDYYSFSDKFLDSVFNISSEYLITNDSQPF